MAGPELDDVEVEFEDLVLAQDLLDVVGEDHLLELARQRLLAGEKEVLRELHADGAGAADEATGLEVRDERAADGRGTEAVMGTKRAVLGGRHGDLHERADAIERGVAVGARTGELVLGGAVRQVDAVGERVQERVAGEGGRYGGRAAGVAHVEVEGEVVERPRVEREAPLGAERPAERHVARQRDEGGGDALEHGAARSRGDHDVEGGGDVVALLIQDATCLDVEGPEGDGEVVEAKVAGHREDAPRAELDVEPADVVGREQVVANRDAARAAGAVEGEVADVAGQVEVRADPRRPRWATSNRPAVPSSTPRAASDTGPPSRSRVESPFDRGSAARTESDGPPLVAPAVNAARSWASSRVTDAGPGPTVIEVLPWRSFQLAASMSMVA